MYPSRNIVLRRVSLWFREIIVIVVSMTVPKYRLVQGRAQKVFFFFLIQDMRVNLYVQGTLQRARLKIPFAPVSGSKILHIVLLYFIECFSSTVKNNV